MAFRRRSSRVRISRRSGNRSFSRHSAKTHRRNIVRGPMRGGIRM